MRGSWTIDSHRLLEEEENGKLQPLSKLPAAVLGMCPQVVFTATPRARASTMTTPNKSILLVATITFLMTSSAVAHEILLGRPTDDSISVNVLPDLTGDLYFEYGTTSGVYTDQTSTIACTAGDPCEVLIDSLSADTLYYYRMQFRETAQSWVPTAEYSFHTQRPPGSPFTFTITSDSHVDILLGTEAIWTQTLNNVAADHPDLHLDLGDTFAMDTVSAGDVAGAEAAYAFQRPFFGIISTSTPVFLVQGNHEQGEGWHLVSPLETNRKMFYYSQPIH